MCVLVCALRLHPATPGWGARCGCVCLGSGFGCAPPLLAGLLGCVCARVRAQLAPRHSWLGCAVWVCVFGLGFWLRPATPGWGVRVCVSVCLLPLYPASPGRAVRRGCVCLSSGFGCAPPLLARVLGCGCVCACHPCTPQLLAGVCEWGCVCLGSGFGCTPPILAGVLGCVWPLTQGRMGDLSQFKEDLEQKITTWLREVDLKLMKSVWGAHVRTPEEDDPSEECVCEPPRVCLCCHCPPEMVERDLLFAYQGLKDTTKGEESVEDHFLTSITQGASNLHSDEDMEDKIKLLDQRVQRLIRTYVEVFGGLPPPASCDKLVQMDFKLKPGFVLPCEGHKIRNRPYPAPEEQADEIERQIQECIDAGLVLEYREEDYPQHCSPCFLVAKPWCTDKRLVVDCGELDKKTLNHSGSIPNMESTLEKIAPRRYKTKMDKRSGFWQVDLTFNAQELLPFIAPRRRVFQWKVIPFGVANAPALFQELMNKIMSMLRRRPKVQELISRGAQMEAHIDDVCLGTNTQEDHLSLLGEFFAVCQENHTRLKLEKCEFMQETMQYLGFDVGYGWWTPAASKAKPP